MAIVTNQSVVHCSENINTQPYPVLSDIRHSRRRKATALEDITNVACNLQGRFDSNLLTDFAEQEMFYKDIEIMIGANDNDDIEDNIRHDENMADIEICNTLTHLQYAYHTSTASLDHQIYNEGYIDEGDPIHKCKFCGALMWFNERVKKDNKKRSINIFSMCCMQGKIVLPPLKTPPPIFQRLFLQKDNAQTKNFLSNIRQYNNMFSFTSMGGKIDHSKNFGGGPYSFILSGQNYHNIGSLLPVQGSEPVYSQLYIFDTDNEVSNRIAVVSKHQKESTIDPGIVVQIKMVLDEINPFVQQYRFASQFLSIQNHQHLKLCLLSSRAHDGRTYNLPSASEVAALIVGDIDMTFNVRDIIVEEQSGRPQRINELHPAYLPLQYPLLFPYGEDGYRDDIEHRQETLAITKSRKRLSIREFFTYRLMRRENEVSILLHASRLLQQFIVDGYTMIESQRLLWVRTHQKELRADLYQGLSDAVLSGERNASHTGKRIILPSTFTGGARYMLQNYQDAMALCRWAGYPDLFITFTCNPAWPEITRLCQQDNVSPCDRPEILSRVFKMKLRSFMKTLREKKIFGTIRAEVYTIEFQKRGLPHAHILLFLDENDKIKDPKAIDRIISAEIPDKHSSSILYDLVQKYMIHGPCGIVNPKSPCMKDNKCSKYFPKKFNDVTTVDDDGYPTYRRRNDGKTIEVKGVCLDNRYVVPYNPTLLCMFQGHINVEKCNQSTSIKYLFKYISKGNDRVVATIFDKDNNKDEIVDEIRQYYSCRYISACEASWRMFGFDIHYRFPPVERLSFHLPNQQYVIYSNTDDVADLLQRPRVSESQFLAWMKMNNDDDLAANLTYAEFPNYYVYQKDKRQWKRREKGFAVGRITHVSPSSGELYYLRILLNKVKGPTSFDDIKTVDGVIHDTFKAACFARGLLEDDNEYIAAIKEASVWASGSQLRRLFVSMLLCCSLQHPDTVWKETSNILSEDLLHIPRNDPVLSDIHISLFDKENMALKEINNLLRANGKTLHEFPSLPLPLNTPVIDIANHLIMQELNYDRESLKLKTTTLMQKLNDEQRIIYDNILSATNLPQGGFFFVYGYGGTGKTFLWNVLITTLRAKGEIVLPVASSGIAATLLPSGRTAHSRFAIPIQITESSVCGIKQNSPLANLIKSTKLIIWDEAPMVQRYCIEAFDRTLKDIMHSNLPFGGKCIVMGGDFRQILPVIPKGTRATIVNASINSSYLWNHCRIFKLTKNMRLRKTNSSNDRERLEWFSNWLLNIGDGKIGQSKDGVADIEIPKQLLLTNYDNALHAIVHSTYPDLLHNLASNDYFNDRAILAPTIEMVNQINYYMCSLLPGDSFQFLSCDTVCKADQEIDTVDDLYNTEFLNTISCSGMPPHKLELKVGAPIMLLRNIDQASGLCNGTRLKICHLGKNVIEAVTLNGSSPYQKVLIHRMDMNPSESRWPFKMQRRQFPITLSFAMTINKSQGQSLTHVGLYLPKPVFTHGQLYVALSRVRSMDGLKVVVDDQDGCFKSITTNVVYKEIFRNIDGNCI
ncbi:uncharacterized protein LOC114724813 [Neltuma alba]|uniref:uncharacterized protein LOC114724813 n=1 Tax=Neltuma alba TaxID=207710 RepID=UPI0010A357DA|nr:uncharacterized protein LOC114724813 [Prosopis alba]